MDEGIEFDENVFTYTHEKVPKENHTLITIIRNPKDTITSWVAMENHYKKHINVNRQIETAKLLYVDYYDYLLNIDIDIILNYDFLNTQTDLIITYLSKKLNLKLTNKTIKPSQLSNVINEKHLVTSTENPNYYNIKQMVYSDAWDFEEENKVYEKLLYKSYPKLAQEK